MENNDKKILVQIVDETKKAQVRNLCIFSPTDEGVQLSFACDEDTGEQRNVQIFEQIIIPKELMRVTLFRFYDALIEYEKKYNDGLGFKVTNDSNDNKSEN